MIMPTKVV